jgi:hypothetical protein
MRATRKSLTESALVTYEEEVLAQDDMDFLRAGCARSHRHAYEYPSGSSLVCLGLDHNEDRILSTAWDVIFANEATAVRQEVWETLASRMRRPGRSRRFGWMLADTNPASPDHWFLKRVEAGTTEHWETTHRANPRMFDGQDWTPEGLQYLDQLHGLTGLRRKRLLQGLWVAGEGVWFDSFDPDVHVTTDAEFDEALPVHCSIDSGVHTGAVMLQYRDTLEGPYVNIFADYFSEGQSAESSALAILDLMHNHCSNTRRRISTDSAGGARNPVGPSVISEYERVGLRGSSGIEQWPKYPGCVTAGLATVEALIGDTKRGCGLKIHPRCRHTINAFQSYVRARRANQWMDYPDDPMHPFEDMIDSIRGVLSLLLPEGRKPPLNLPRMKAGRIF